ncbi:MAG TPA: VOC family protein [Phenylobacterium sp.]|uniref:VOC family protein n=1 Tax=Phenylobacterium sp. TaxID=1871053 RepID=UPI002B5BFFB5|nr:VOC family protein [Phenylobacterium sp.]HSV01591.1 VOC family protein [Phenylobacterium sp.]
MTIQLDHLILPVSDVERSVRFYHRVLGFRYEPVALVRVTPTLVLQLIPRAPEVSQHLAFSMTREEFQGAVERLRAAEIPFGDDFDSVGNMKGPGKAHGSQKDGDSIYFRDPDGHMLEIIHYELA